MLSNSLSLITLFSLLAIFLPLVSAQAAGAGAGGVIAGVPPAGSSWPFSLMSGPTKYAPMQVHPPTKMAGSATTRLYPTSAWTIATTFLPIPIQVTTLTAPGTFTVSSRENTASPAPMPSNDFQKFLNRWRD